MENSDMDITGARKLSQNEIDLINDIKKKAEEVRILITLIDAFESKPDPRWVNIGKTDLQKGFMALTRAVAKQETF